MFCSITAGLVVLMVVYYVIDLVLRSLTVGKVTDKHVLITGCDSGFGKLAASRLDKLGFHVFAACLTKDGATSLSETCSSRLTTLILDVTSTQSIEEAVQFVQGKLPPDTGLWALINNAGVMGLFAPNEFCTREDVLECLSVNLLGLIEVTSHFLPLIRKCQGRIVNTSSICGRFAFIPIPYTISKFGVEGYSDMLRREVRHQGVKVSMVEPGAFMTPIFTADTVIAGAEKAFGRANPEVQAAYGGTSILTRTRDVLNKLSKSASHDLGLVVDAYTHAITSRYPRTRYQAGADSKFFYIPISYLPDRVGDFIFSLM